MEEATHAFVWVKPKQNFMKRKPTLTIGPDTGITNVNRIVEIQKKVPTITAINMRSPWLINEIEPNAAAVIATFGVKTEAFVDVIRGRFNPAGKLPFTIQLIKKQWIMRLGIFQDSGSSFLCISCQKGDAYGYNFGLSYSTETNATTTIMDEWKKLVEEGIVEN